MPFRISSVPEIGVPGIRNARPTKKEAMPIRTMMSAANETRAPRTVMPTGRRIQLPPQRKEEQDGNLSGAKRRAQITPTGLCHSSTSPLLPDTALDGAHKMIRLETETHTRGRAKC